MSFLNIAPLGGYHTGDLITEDQINYWCGVLPDAIDAAQGGTYTLTAALLWGGTGTLTLNQTNVVIGTDTGKTLTLGASTVFNAPFQFNFDGIMGGFCTFTSGANFKSYLVTIGQTASDSFIINSTTDINGPLEVDGAATFNGVTSVVGNLAIHSSSTTIGDNSSDLCNVNATAFFNQGVSFAKPINFSATGKLCFRTKTIATTGNQTVQAAFYDTVRIPVGVLNTGDQISIDDTGCADGMRIHFYCEEVTNVANIYNGIQIFPLRNTIAVANTYYSITFERTGGVWRPIAFSQRCA